MHYLIINNQNLKAIYSLIQKLKKQSEKLIEFEIKSMVGEEDIKVGTIKSDEANSQMYFTNCPQHLSHLVKAKKGIIYYNEGFIYGLFGDKSLNSVAIQK